MNLIIEWLGNIKIESPKQITHKSLDEKDQIYVKKFTSKISINLLSNCWEWSGKKDSKGYGMFSFYGKFWRSHRVSYKLFKGELMEGLVLDHLCRNTSCVNPDHLEQVTNRENVLRGVGFSALNFKKTHCPKGHILTQRKTNRPNGRRHCKICNNNYSKQI